MAYSVGQFTVVDTFANLASGGAGGPMTFVLDTGRFYTWNGSAYVSADAPQIGTIASSATPSINCDVVEQYNITALAAAITGVTVTGTPTDGQQLDIRIKDNGTLRAIAFGSAFVGILLTTTATSKTHLQRCKWDAAAGKWAGYLADATGY